MTTAALAHRIRRIDPRTVLLVACFLLWAVIVAGVWLRLLIIRIPHALPLLLVGVPVLSVLAALLRRRSSAALPSLAGWTVAIVAAFLFAPFIASAPLFALAIPGVAVGAVATHRFPTFSLSLMFFLVGTYGTVQAFTGIPPGQVFDFILGGMWVGIAGRMVIGRQPFPVRFTPALMLFAAFMAMTFVAVLLSQEGSLALRSFRFCGWHLSSMLLIAVGAFRARTLEILTRAMILISLVVAAYATLRWVIGHAAASELALSPQQYNKLARTGDTKLQGSMPDAQELGVWMACAIPFLVAMSVSLSGLWRVVAVGTLPVTLIGLLASGQRTAAAAVVAGSLTVIVVHVLARGFPGPRLSIALAAIALIGVSAAVVYPAVLDNPEKRKRYENLLTPKQDDAFQERLVKWRQALADLRGEPFGFGLGEGDTGVIKRRLLRPGSDVIDNSYLKIAYEQGLLVMGFFIFALFVLLIELLRHAIWSRAPGAATLTTAAVGSLVAMMIEFFTGNHIDSLAITTGWMIVGLGIAQYASDRPGGAQPSFGRRQLLEP